MLRNGSLNWERPRNFHSKILFWAIAFISLHPNNWHIYLFDYHDGTKHYFPGMLIFTGPRTTPSPFQKKGDFAPELLCLSVQFEAQKHWSCSLFAFCDGCRIRHFVETSGLRGQRMAASTRAGKLGYARRRANNPLLTLSRSCAKDKSPRIERLLNAMHKSCFRDTQARWGRDILDPRAAWLWLRHAQTGKSSGVENGCATAVST